MRYCIKSLKWKKNVFFWYCVIFLIAVRLFRLWKSAGSALRRQSRFWQTLTSTCWGCGAQWARFKLTCSTLMMLQITPGRWWRDTCKCENTEDFPVIPMSIIYLMLIERTGCQLEKVKNTTQIESHPSNRKLYHPNNAALGMAAMRAGVTHWQAGQIEVAHGMICKAYAILMVTHGPTHPITKDLDVSVTLKLFKLGLLKLFNRNKTFPGPLSADVSVLISSQAMRIQTEMELRMFKQNEYVYHSMREAALKNKPMTMMHEPKSVEEGIKNLFHRRKWSHDSNQKSPTLLFTVNSFQSVDVSLAI